MRPIQQSLLGQQDTFMPIAVSSDHEMVILSQNLDWDLMQTIGECSRDKIIKSNRGLKPHYRALNGAVVVRTLKNSTFRDTEDLIKNYNPARFLCDLQNSTWTPDHVAIWEYEGMLGESGLQEMTDYVLRTASGLGFADARGLCTDTTAQEGNIPYPTEVGHMNTFLKSVRANLDTLVKNGKELPAKAVGKMKELFGKMGKKVREHRLFAKTKEAKREIEQCLEEMNNRLLNQLGNMLGELDIKKNKIKGMGVRAVNNLAENFNAMCEMKNQISTWIKTGKVVSGKIISLFNTNFRAINRGKAGKKIEFGLKWGINQVRGGYVSIFMHQAMMCHDANYAVMGVQEHIRIFGKPPKDFGFDRAAWSAEHKDQIKKLGVKNLAIAPKGRAEWEVGPRVKDRMVRERAQIEGKIGTMKKRGLNKSEARINSRVQQSAFRAALSLNLRRFAKDLSMASTMKLAEAV